MYSGKDGLRGPTGRALMACQFCRGKKMKCNSARPRCRNCEAYDRQCVYVELDKQPRPSKARIARLEEELRDLQSELHELRLKSSGEDAKNTTPSNLQVMNGLLGVKDSLLLRDIFPADKNEKYHGPTSAMFEDDSAGSATAPTKQSHTRSQRVQKDLFAESAKERALENVNLAAGKFDFDGVEPELAMHLLSIFWERNHHWALIVYRSAFMRDMASDGPYFSKLLLNAIFFAASKFTSRTEVRHEAAEPVTAGWRFRRRVMELMPPALDRSCITTVQALLVVASSLFSWCDERSAAWLYAGIALRMVVDLGLHVEAPGDAGKFCNESVEIRRRVFWAAFVLDKLQSLYQGRPVSLRDTDMRIPIEFEDNYEEISSWTATANMSAVVHYDSTEPGYSVSWLGELCKLSVIIDRILSSLYTEKRAGDDILCQFQKAIGLDLKTWRANLPSCFHLERLENGGLLLPHVLSLMCLYTAVVILLHRPFVSDGHLQAISPTIASESFAICASAATDFTRYLCAYEREFSLKKAPFIMSYAAYVSATIHVRVASQGAQNDSSAHASLRVCLRVLDQNQTTYWAATRANRIIRGLARRMGVNLDESHDGVTNVQDSSPSTIPSNWSVGTPSLGTDSPLITIGDYEMAVRDIDIDAVMRSFVMDADFPQPSAFSMDEVNTLSGIQRLDVGPNFEANQLSLDMSDSQGFNFNDPIFGFSSSALDGFDSNFPPCNPSR